MIQQFSLLANDNELNVDNKTQFDEKVVNKKVNFEKKVEQRKQI